MAFTGTFTKTAVIPSTNWFTLTDTSNYTSEPKNTFSGRRFYMMYIDGTFVQSPEGNDYWDFGFSAYPSDTIQIEALTADVALTIQMVWIPITPVTGSTYVAVEVFDFKDNAKAYKLGLTQDLAANRNLKNIQNWWESYDALQSFIDFSTICIVNQDQYSSQWAINNATFLTENPNLFN